MTYSSHREAAVGEKILFSLWLVRSFKEVSLSLTTVRFLIHNYADLLCSLRLDSSFYRFKVFFFKGKLRESFVFIIAGLLSGFSLSLSQVPDLVQYYAEFKLIFAQYSLLIFKDT